MGRVARLRRRTKARAVLQSKQADLKRLPDITRALLDRWLPPAMGRVVPRNANRNEPSQGRSLLRGQDMGKAQDHRNSTEQWLAVAGGWWSVAVGGWRWLAVGGWWLVAVSGWRLVAVGGVRQLAVGGWRLVVRWGCP